MKTFYVFFTLCWVIFFPASHSIAANYFEGEIVGFNCIMEKVDCDSDMYKFAHISFEPDFVLKVGEKKHYMLDGVPRSMKLRMAGQNAYITGSLIKSGTTISVSKMEMDVGDKRVICWDQKIADGIIKDKKLKNDWVKSLQKELDLYGH